MLLQWRTNLNTQTRWMALCHLIKGSGLEGGREGGVMPLLPNQASLLGWGSYFVCFHSGHSSVPPFALLFPPRTQVFIHRWVACDFPFVRHGG